MLQVFRLTVRRLSDGVEGVVLRRAETAEEARAAQDYVLPAGFEIVKVEPRDVARTPKGRKE